MSLTTFSLWINKTQGGSRGKSEAGEEAQPSRDQPVTLRLGEEDHSQIRTGKKKQGRWGEERGKDQSWKTKSQVARGVADFRVCASHVACDSMQGLTRSARGTDGPTQQYLCMHVCAFRLHAFLNMICSSTYWPLQVKEENCSCNLIIYHKLPAKHNSPSTPTHRCRYTPVHIKRSAHTEVAVYWLQDWLLPVESSVMWHMVQTQNMSLGSYKQKHPACFCSCGMWVEKKTYVWTLPQRRCHNVLEPKVILKLFVWSPNPKTMN